MSIFNDKALKSVAEAASKIMAEKLHPNQQKLDVHEPEKDELTAKDFEMLRKGKKAKDVKEETEQVQEGWDDMMKAVAERSKPQPSGGAGVKQGTRYGGSKQKEEPEEKEMPKKKKMSEMLSTYKEGGIKALSEKLVKEEPDNEQFTKELKDQEASAAGKKKQPSVAAAATKGVKAMDEEVQQLEERTLTEPETEKKEKLVKSMKKGLAGFKQRYGDRAKSVMYATATKLAKKD